MLDVSTTDNQRRRPSWCPLILRMLRLATLAAMAVPLAGCIINLDGTSPGSSMGSGSRPTKWTWSDMGSGQFASAGFGNAANFRNPSYFDLSGAPQWPSSDPNVTKDTKPVNDACYTKTNLSANQAPWERWFYVGGPGGDAPNQDCPVLR
jgi:hypothetical protein